MKKLSIITICASVSAYRTVMDMEKELKRRGFKVIVPSTAKIMKRSGNFDVTTHKTWYKNKADYHKKAALMMLHFKEVARADAILVVNTEKNGVKGYIGGNVLMEMALAFYLRKKIYLWEEADKKSKYIEEILGMNPTLINKNVANIT